MIPPRDFWLRLDEHSGPGVLLLIVLKSWKPVADSVGMEATDVLSGVFDALCGLATSTAMLRSRLSTIVYAAYWRGQGSELESARWLGRWLPMSLQAPKVTVPLQGVPVLVTRGGGEVGASCYVKAQEAVDALVQSLPEAERYPALAITWEEAAGL